MASRVVPIFFILFSIYLFAVHRSSLRKRWRGVAIFFLTYALVSAPLAIYLLGNPGLEYRLSEINQPLLSLMEGDVLPALGNAFKVIGMFGFQGDPLWRQNVANLPVFEPIVAAFFYIGLLITLFRWRKPPYAFIMLWLLTAAIPSVVSIDAPSSIRIINILPVLTIFPVIGLEVIHFLRSTVFTKLSPKNVKIATIIGLVFLFGFNIARSSWATFQEWPSEEEVRFVWQAALTDAAGYLDESESSAPVALGGWTPESMDPPTMELSLGREDLSLRYFDPTQTLIIPRGDNAAQEARILAPTALPLDPLLEEQLRTWGAPAQDLGNFTLYVVPGGEVLLPQNEFAISFADEITFLGYDQPTPCLRSISDHTSSSIECQLVTYWRVDRPASGPQSIFLHALDDEDNIVSQDDGLGAPAEHWQPGDLILQRHTLELLPSAGALTFRLGIYNPETGVRLSASDGQEFVILPLDD
jgi:hypothetical protein